MKFWKKGMLIMTVVVIICNYSGCSKKNNTDTGLTQEQLEEMKADEEFAESIVTEEGTLPLDENTGTNVLTLVDGLADNTLEVVGQDYEGVANLEQNVKGDEDMLLFCKDPVYDVSYFVNYQTDYFIYRLKDGEAQLVLRLPAQRLFCHGGNLYFILNNVSIGNLYSFTGIDAMSVCEYNPVTGKVKVVIDEPVDTMYVYNDGIYAQSITISHINPDTEEFNLNQQFISRESYYYSFESEQCTKMDKDTGSLFFWNDYAIDNYQKIVTDEKDEVVKSGIKLSKRDGSEEITINDDGNSVEYCVYQDKLYYLMQYKPMIVSYDLNTGEKIEYPLVEDTESLDFVIVNDKIYVNNMIELDLQTGMQSVIQPEDESLVAHTLYTDGENLYGVYGQGDNYILELNTIYQGEMCQYTINETENTPETCETDDGQPYELNHWSFSASPIKKVPVNYN